ncbi:hypothetical protein [Luteolibacter sp. LG18]|uniref:hypothetical protein n=1 Tax=Luteolibacter sp. LG18 TaxID=2819286 RepID=UPI002B30B96D|nr:hypothetical protein llg_23190 [Luteolibacter sp. LG18]
MRSNLLSCLLAALLCTALHAGPVVDVHDGTAWKPLEEAAWKELPRVEATAKGRDGTEHRYSGVPLIEIAKRFGAPSGEALRGQEMNRAVLLSAADNYKVVFSLAELDPAFTRSRVILVDRVDDAALTAFEGPLMILAVDDLRHSRWIRQVKQIALIRTALPEPRKP